MVKLLHRKTYWLEFHTVEPVLGTLLFLIYINDLPNGIESICKIFEAKDETFSDTQLNKDLNKISKWALKWKMLFKVCVRYIFASLFLKSKREHLSN